MKYARRNIALGFLIVLVLSFAAGCSSKGVHMPKHRKRRHCNCPTFTEASPTEAVPVCTFRYQTT